MFFFLKIDIYVKSFHDLPSYNQTLVNVNNARNVW